MITNKKSGKIKVSIILVSLIVILFNSWGDRNIVAEYGNLRVEGAHLKGNPGIVSLKGFSSHGIQWFPFKDDSTIPNMVADFGADVIRIAMYIEHEQMGYLYTPQGSLRGKKYMTEQVNMMVQDAIDAGIYVIIDWHIHNNPNNFTSEAISFFQDMVILWGNKPNVIFEIANEPQWVSWGDISRYANKVIPAIRAKEDEIWGKNDPDNIIIVGTPDWNQHPDYVIGYELPFPNILYALHFYTASHFEPVQWQAKTAFNAGLPLFISEWGLSHYTGGGGNNYANAEKWMNWAESNNISWVYWAFDNKDESSAVLNSFEWDNENNERRWRENEDGLQSGPWKDSDLTIAGHWIRKRMGWTAPTPTPKPTSTPIPTSKPTSTPTPKPTSTPTPTAIRWATPTPTLEPAETLKPGKTEEPTPTPTLEPIKTPIAEPTPTSTLEPIKTPIAEPTPTSTLEPIETPIAEPTPTSTLEPIKTPIAELTPTPTLEPIETPIAEPTSTPNPEPTKTPKQGKSSKNPIKITQNSISYFLDLSDGYVWVEFPDPITGWAIENTGYSFNVQLEKNNRSIIEKTTATWYYIPKNPNLKKSGVVKIVNRGSLETSPYIIIRYWY